MTILVCQKENLASDWLLQQRDGGPGHQHASTMADWATTLLWVTNGFFGAVWVYGKRCDQSVTKLSVHSLVSAAGWVYNFH